MNEGRREGGHLTQVGGTAGLGGWREVDGGVGGEFGRWSCSYARRRSCSERERSSRWHYCSPQWDELGEKVGLEAHGGVVSGGGKNEVVGAKEAK